MNFKRFAMMALLTLLLANGALAAEYYVDPQSGSDSNPGTISQPWKTVAYAEANAANGSTIYLKQGNYGDVTISRTSNNGRSSWAQGITFTAQDPQSPPIFKKIYILDETETNVIDRYITFDGIKVDCPYGDGISLPVYIKDGGYIKIINSEIKGVVTDWQSTSTMELILIGKGDYTGIGVKHITIENCEVHNSSWGLNVKGNSYGGIVIRNNEVHDIGASAIRLSGESNGYRTFIENNYIHTHLSVKVPNKSEDIHASGLSLRTENVTASGNIIRAYASSTAITTYRDIYPVHGYRNMVFENNLVYDSRSPYYCVRLDDVGDNLVFNNNTITGTHTDGRNGNVYYENAFRFDGFAEQIDLSTIQLKNNILVGYTGGFDQEIQMEGNLFYTYKDGEWVGQSWMDTHFPGNFLFGLTEYGTAPPGSTTGTIFKGGTLFEQYAYKRPGGLYHGVDLGDAFYPAPDGLLCDGSLNGLVGVAAAGAFPCENFTCNNDSECDDGKYCNGQETCNSGTCQAGTSPCTDDGYSCTTLCDEGTHACNQPNNSTCDDQNPCTNDTCLGAGGQAGTGCSYTNNSSSCDDGISCTQGDQCSGGTCQGTPNDSICPDYPNCTSKTCTLSGCTYQPQGCAIQTSPIAWFRFEGNLQDEEGGNNGTFQGGTAPYTTGKLGQAIAFDGTDDRVETASNLFSNSTFGDGVTLSAWVKGPLPTSDRQIISVEGAYYIGTSDTGHLTFHIDGDYESFRSTTKLDGTWHLVTGTADSQGNVKIYVDAAEEASGTQSYYSLDSLNRPLTIGSHAAGSLNFEGSVDDVRVYDRALTQTEILSLYNEAGGECVDMAKLVNQYIPEWKLGNITMIELLEKIASWKAGTGC